MRITAALKATALMCAAVLMALFTVQGTLALWSATAASPAQAMQTADFAVTIISPAGTAQLAPAQAVTIPAVTGLKPGTSQTVPVTVKNATDAGNGAFTARITAGVPLISGPLAGHLTAVVSPAQGTNCATVLTGSSITLAQGVSGVFCLKVSMAAAAPATLGGSNAAVTIPLTAQQL
ncbi:hypothetical protein ACFVYC_10965 [Pseudarthrobacter sp. NPDC058329]|uniref:hypothetical protein n=1 Tax=Pseudarthrobacter sp. NPDC058329 TaxID=3346448 RepID=UPI0036DB2C08